MAVGGRAMRGRAVSVTDGDREKAIDLARELLNGILTPLDMAPAIAAALAEEREKALAPFLALLDVEPDIQPLWDFERGALRGIEMTKEAIRKAAEETK